jgi:uncharacterized phage-associated protein
MRGFRPPPTSCNLRLTNPRDEIIFIKSTDAGQGHRHKKISGRGAWSNSSWCRRMRTPFNRERFKQLVHYVIWAAEKYDGFGATKLYKVLWFAESRAFVLRGRPLAGAEYIREKHGPVPKLGKVIRDDLEREGKIKQVQQRAGGMSQWRFKSLSRPDVSFLSKEDKRDLDWWIRHIAVDHTAKSISDMSHEDDGCWQMATMGETLPFHAFMVTRIRDELTDEELEWAKERAGKLGLR